MHATQVARGLCSRNDVGRKSGACNVARRRDQLGPVGHFVRRRMRSRGLAEAQESGNKQNTEKVQARHGFSARYRRDGMPGASLNLAPPPSGEKWRVPDRAVARARRSRTLARHRWPVEFCCCFRHIRGTKRQGRMSSRKRISAVLFFVYLLALVQGGQADASFQAVGSCVPEACADSSTDIRSHAPVLSATGQQLRLFNEPTRLAGDLSFRFTAGISDACLETNAALGASGRAAAFEHRDVAHLIRAASLGLPACAPRSPPIIR
ncbi:MAG TPA: hypothetical protein VK933_16415 [Longimicrobiales bacterium]|nr:hypothetical protein [Longimicrobiales bacterium]